MTSIGLPIFNCELRIRRVLDSLLGQTDPDIELIISDDGSTDASFAVCQEYAARDQRIRLFRQTVNIGYLRNFEFVLKQARGEYFMWAADDDWWDARCIAMLHQALVTHPAAGLAMPSLRQVYDDGAVFEEVVFSGWRDLTRYSYQKAFRAAVTKNVPVQFLYYGLFRMAAIRNLLTQPFADTIAHDKALMMEAALSLRFVTISDILWHKTTYHQVYYERYTPAARSMFLDKRGYARYVAAAIRRLTFSKNIPLGRKLLLPYYATMIVWAEKKNLAKQLFPRLFSMVRSRRASKNIS